MKLRILTPSDSLRDSLKKHRINRAAFEDFKKNIRELLAQIDSGRFEDYNKNILTSFLSKTFYSPGHNININKRTDLVIRNGKDVDSSVGVLIEAKRPEEKKDMLSKGNINVKALHEMILYYLRERISGENNQIKHLIATDFYQWFVFDAQVFDKLFAENKKFVERFKEFEARRLSSTHTKLFYEEIAAPYVAGLTEEIKLTYFDLRDYRDSLSGVDPEGEAKLIALYKILSPNHLLKQRVANDSNALNKDFYAELLHIIGLKQVAKGGKKLIQRKEANERNRGSLLENTIYHLEQSDRINHLPNPEKYGKSNDERLFNVGLELCITWMNRILFLKLMEAQLVKYHGNDKSYGFLHIEKIPFFGVLNRLFFNVLAIKNKDRDESLQKVFGHVPYLNSSLFEVSDIERDFILISSLSNDRSLPLHPRTVLRNELDKVPTGEMGTLEYLLEFLGAYDFSSEGSEEIQEKGKGLISASVLGLIFEKINGYEDGSYFTPGFITEYMCRETIKKAILQKFREAKGWDYDNLTDLHNKIEPGDIKEANKIVNDLKVCDPAVGSGHFLVSALNEIIAIKQQLGILTDKDGQRLRDYEIKVVDDELMIMDGDRQHFKYKPGHPESQRLQEALFYEKQTIIENCLFGVDINPNSVRICRLRLWIELLKNAYYKEDTGFKELETLPNIDINIKYGNSLISRFALDAGLGQALKKSKWTIDTYQTAVEAYRHAHNKEEKREMLQLIRDIKNDFRTEINANDPKVVRLIKLKGELFNLTNQTQLFDRSKKEQAVWDKKLDKLTQDITKLEAEIEEIKSNKIYDNAFEWRFEFPEVLNDDGGFVGFDLIIGNPPYLQLSKTEDITKEHKNYLLETYETSGGRLNTFIFFIHLSNRIMHPNGFLHFIIPNTILSQEYYTFTRDFLVNKVSLTEIVNFPILPFEDAVIETVLIQYANRPNLVNNVEIKELSKESVKSISRLKGETINRDSKYSFVYQFDPIIEKVYEKEHFTFGSICEINQGIALKGDKALSLINSKENDECYKLLDGRNINKYSVKWGGVWLDYDLDKIHSCKRKDIFETAEKLMFRRVSSSLIFTYDNERFYALNTLVVVNKKDLGKGPDLKFILGLMNSKLMNYVYINKFKSTKTVFSEIQARSVKELPIPSISDIKELEIIKLSEKIIDLKKNNSDTAELEHKIDRLVYQLYDLTEEEIEIIENS